MSKLRLGREALACVVVLIDQALNYLVRIMSSPAANLFFAAASGNAKAN